MCLLAFTLQDAAHIGEVLSGFGTIAALLLGGPALGVRPTLIRLTRRID